MTEEEKGRQQESLLENAVGEAIKMDYQEGIVVGWFVAAVVQEPNDPQGMHHHVYFAPGGQPLYASVGILDLTIDELRHPSDD